MRVLAKSFAYATILIFVRNYFRTEWTSDKWLPKMRKSSCYVDHWYFHLWKRGFWESITKITLLSGVNCRLIVMVFDKWIFHDSSWTQSNLLFSTKFISGKVDDIVTKNISKNALELNLVERLERTCSIPNVLKNWDSCAALSAIFMNPKFSKIPSPPVALDVKRGIEYAVKACEGAGNGLGHQMSCVNLANLYERGNKMLGVDRNVELSNYFKEIFNIVEI